MCQNASIRTVEDLAAANADTLRKLGMGSVALKDKAATFLGSAQTNKASEEISALNVEMEALKETIEKQSEQIEALLEDAPKKRGRKKKSQDYES
jgi:hypothetical protein